MKYIEYVYLLLAFMCLIFLGTEFGNLATRQVISVCVAMGIFSFMFAFRRSQRMRMEGQMDELLAEWAEDAEVEEEESPDKTTS